MSLYACLGLFLYVSVCLCMSLCTCVSCYVCHTVLDFICLKWVCRRECSGAEWAEMCMMCGENYEPVVPRWVQLLQVQLLEDQVKPATQTDAEVAAERERKDVLDRELLAMVDTKLYLCWICLAQVPVTFARESWTDRSI